MKGSNSPAATSAWMMAMDSSAPPSSSPSSSTNSVLSSLSLSKLSPSPSSKPLYDHTDAKCLTPSKPFFSLVRKKRPTHTWFSRLFSPSKTKLSMEAQEGLLQKPSPDDGDAQICVDRPKSELRFAAKIAAAMDADGFMGVKDSVCADEMPSGMKQTVSVGAVHCGLDHHAPRRAPYKQSRSPLKPTRQPRRRWRVGRRLCKTRVLFACILQKVRKVFSKSSKRSLQVRDELINK